MIELNLTTSNKEQKIIKRYLQENASEVLANKINNGVKIVKDNVNLTNKKDLNGFMKYASSEARKLAEKVQIVLVLKIKLYMVGQFTILKKMKSKEIFTTKMELNTKLKLRKLQCQKSKVSQNLKNLKNSKQICLI